MEVVNCLSFTSERPPPKKSASAIPSIAFYCSANSNSGFRACCTRSCYDARWLYGAATSAGIKHRSVEEARKLGIVWRAIDSFSVKRVDIGPLADRAEVSGHFAFPSC